MSDFLDRAKAQQAKTAAETHCWIRLDLLEGLIGEIEALRGEVRRLQPAPGRGSIRAIREGLELKEEKPS
jgi:hypothetical protein